MQKTLSAQMRIAPELLSPHDILRMPFEMSAHVVGSTWMSVSEAPESPCTGEGLNLAGGTSISQLAGVVVVLPAFSEYPRASTRKNVGHLP